MNTSAVLNGTVEFPPWRQLTAVNILLYVGVLLPTTLVMNISVLIALMKSKVKYKSLLILFGSLLITVCIEKLILCVGQCVLSPNAFRYCLCNELTVLVFQVPRVFFGTYAVIIITCMSLTQLSLMKGKIVSYSKIIACLIISIVIALFWTFAVFIGNLLDSDLPYCYVYCEFLLLSATFGILIFFIAVTLTPAFLTAIIASILALRKFRDKIMACRDSKNEIELNRRILLLPFLMAILQLFNTSVPYVTTVMSSAILLNFDVGEYYGSLANIIASFEYFIFDIIHCLFFPLALLYLYTDVRKTWKKLVFKMFSCRYTNN